MNFIEGGGTRGTLVSAALMLPLSDATPLHETATSASHSALPRHVPVSITERRVDARERARHRIDGNETFVFLRLPNGEKIIARAPADFRAEMETLVGCASRWKKLPSSTPHRRVALLE